MTCIRRPLPITYPFQKIIFLLHNEIYPLPKIFAALVLGALLRLLLLSHCILLLTVYTITLLQKISIGDWELTHPNINGR